MTVDILCPPTGDVTRFCGWFVRVGDEVDAGERIAEVLIPGVAIDVVSPVAGTLVSRCVIANTAIEPGMVLGTLRPSE